MESKNTLFRLSCPAGVRRQRFKPQA